MKLLQLWQICLSSALLLVAVQAKTSAQTSLQPDNTQQNNGNLSNALPQTAIPQPSIITPELPPLQPTLPEPVEFSLRLVLKRSERRVYLYRGEEQVGSYPVAVGKSGWETPLGTWAVNNMQEDPTWIHPFTGEVVPPGSDNPLGDRWIGFWTNDRAKLAFTVHPHVTQWDGPLLMVVSACLMKMYASYTT